MKVLFLFNKVRKGMDLPRNLFFGMEELRQYGHETGYLEIEHVCPAWLCSLLRRYVLSMHSVHLPLFPWFFRYDIIFTSTAYYSMLLKAVLGIRSFAWVLLDFNIRGTIGDANTLRQRIFQFAVSRVDGIVTINEAEKKMLEELFPHLVGRIVCIPEATDTDFFTPTGEKEEDYVLTVGNFGRDFKMLIDAVAGTDMRAIIAGKSGFSSGSLPPNVTHGMYSPGEMRSLYSRARAVFIGINPPEKYADSVGTLSLGEALAMSKAVVVTRTKSMETYITDGTNGIFVPRRDSVALRKVLEQLFSDEKQRNMLGRNARAYAQKELSLKIFAGRLSEFFRTIQ